jgi:serine/threonine-protein kinase
VSYLDDGAIGRLAALATSSGAGDLVGERFELREPIGEGGMGVVHAAWDRQAAREVAVKVLRDVDPAARERFAREVAALGDLAHAAVARPIAHGVTPEGAPFLAMERLRGHTLAERLRQGPLGVRETIALGEAAAGALAAVHAAGLIHRDVKPSNLFLAGDAPAAVRLLDFGLARGRDGLRVTRTGALVGTPGYMAPEQVRGDRDVGPRADVFALGAVLFECLAGHAAFWGDDPERALTKILLEQPPLLRALRPEVSLPLEGLVEAMLHKDPAARPDAAAVARELAVIEAALGVAPARPVDEGAPRLAVGTLVAGKYRVEGTLGEGGMGVILAARHVELGRPVALKLLRAPLGGEAAARLIREAQALSRLESEHVARIMDVGRLDDGAPYLVIERLVGADLGRVLEERGPLAPSEAVDHVLQACEAIAEAHALGIVHRDLKPSNLFLSKRKDGSPCVKVLDFGISKVPGDGADAGRDDRSLTSASAVMGSAWYMSPEQLVSAKHVDARTDIWALGVVLHELVAGSPPFDAATAVAVGARIAAGEPARLREARADAPAALEAVILRCLAKDPGGRYQDVGELARALAPFAEGSRSSVERIGRVLGAGAAVPEAAVAPMVAALATATVTAEATPARGTTASAWGAPRTSAPRGRVAAIAGAAAAVTAGLLVLVLARSPTPASAPAPVTTTGAPTAAPAPAEPARGPEPTRAPEPVPSVITAPASVAPPRAGSLRPKASAHPAPSAIAPAPTAPPSVAPAAPSVAPTAAPAPLPPPPPASPPSTVDVHNPALDGR